MKIFVLIIACVALVQGNICGRHTVTEETYTTTERRLSDDTAFIVKFKLQCSSGAQGFPLFAEVGGKIYPVTKSPEQNIYQLSWVTESSNAASGTYKLRLFDDDGMNVLRKAMRNEEDTSGLSSLFDIEFNHPGNTRDLWLTSEVVGLFVAVLIYYAVCRLRSEVMD
uniref:translocon-associated protein subunit delta-like n=1 Tax=Styela clava TaxID=7725 RepID=UPI00193ACE9C|nr:translocon-associated protein subunit delta-like [Styela clava]